MAPTPRTPQQFVEELNVPPPAGSPYSLFQPGTETEGRTAVLRHWRFKDGPLLRTIDPEVHTAHDIFASTAKRQPNARCLGKRPWDPVTKTFGKYQWITYGEAATRRHHMGAGIFLLHKAIGVTAEKYGVGLWCLNRPEWQITGMLDLLLLKTK